eukprot:TRINITY_DN8631_c0_g1_i1.p1 TRINITY_DN8631_c0_g1~~TRINITY_DN8631_c0_g1_i1.p1  ORF type:complete len:341 (+),score=54.47 TRINITY_DN8631_c0_g1_i1:119-1141(+)
MCIRDRISKDRAKLSCSVCRRHGRDKRTMTHGVAIQCSYFGCAVPFHVTCAQSENMHVRMHQSRQIGEAFCCKHDPMVHTARLPSIGEKRIWNGNKNNAFEVVAVDSVDLCGLRFTEPGDRVERNVRRDCVHVPSSLPEREPDSPSREPCQVTWADGQTYQAELVSEYQLGMVTLECQGWEDCVVLPAASLNPPPSTKPTSHKRKNAHATSQGRDWQANLRPFDGKEVVCSVRHVETRGMLNFPEGASKPSISVPSDSGEDRQMSCLAFETFAGCRTKNAKNSIRLVEEGISLGEAAMRVGKEAAAGVTEDGAAKRQRAADESLVPPSPPQGLGACYVQL